MKTTLKRITAALALCLIVSTMLSSCSLIRSLKSLLDGDGEDPGSPYATEGEIDVSKVELKDLKGEWVDINSATTISFKGDTLTVRFGQWKESYKVVLEKTEYSTTIRAKEGDLGEMSEISVNKDGSLTAYMMVLDGPSRQYRFVREDAVAAETEIQDLSKDEPKTIESREIKTFTLTFANSGETYGLDEDWASGYYSWEIEKSDDLYWMNFRISGDSMIILDFSEEVSEEYVRGLADLIAELNIAEYNGYYKKNNVQHKDLYLYVRYVSREKITVRAEGEAAATCPFDMPALLDYAYQATGRKGWGWDD